MKNWIVIALMIVSTAVLAQNNNIAKIENYTLGEKELAIFPFDKSQKITVGKIDGGGNLLFDWPKFDPSQYDTKGNVIDDGGVFINSCDEIEVKEGSLNGIETMHAGYVYIWNSSRPDGVVIPASSMESNNSVIKENGKNDVAGSYWSWVYASANTKYSAICKKDNKIFGLDKPVLTTKNTNLDLKEGWNLIRFETNEVFTDEGGYTYPVSMNITTVDGNSDDIKWFLKKF